MFTKKQCTHTHERNTHTPATYTSGQPTAEQNELTKQLEEQMRSLEVRRQQLEQEQVAVIKQLRSRQTMEKQFQEAVKVQPGQPGAVVKLVLRKRCAEEIAMILYCSQKFLHEFHYVHVHVQMLRQPLHNTV